MKRGTRAIISAATFMVACLAVPVHAHATPDLPHRGAFTCDFELFVDPATLPDAQAGLIDHDRQLMSSADAAKGFKHKVVPIFVDPSTGKTYGGGRYLFDKWAQARSYEKFVTGSLSVMPIGAGAQPAGKTPRIGFLGNATPALEFHLVGPFREGLRDFGYVEGQNIGIDGSRGTMVAFLPSSAS
jgi:hypothetical protein